MEMKRKDRWSERGAAPEDTRCPEDSYAMQFQSKDLIIAPGDRCAKTPEEEKEAAQLKASGGQHGLTVDHPTTYLETLMHLFKGNVGSGIFAMGDAFKNAGVAMGPWLIIVFGIICVHSQHLLLNASERLTRRLQLETRPDFATTVELTFATGPLVLRRYAPLTRVFVNLFLCVTQLGFCCVYFVFVATNLQQIAAHFGLDLDVHVFMAIILLPILFSCFVRNLKYLAPLSTVANVCMLTGIAIVIYYSVRDLPSVSEREAVAEFSRFPLFFGTALFAFEGIGLVLPLQNEMKRPEQFHKPLGVLNVGMTFVTILYLLMGLLSFLKYGEEVKGSVTLNLPEADPLAIGVKLIICVGMLLTFPLQFYIPIDIMFPSVATSCGPFGRPVLAELIFRTIFVLLTFALAESIPFLELFITLVGALCSSAIALVFPPLLELVACWHSGDLTAWKLTKDLFIVIVGTVGCISGSFESIRLIVKAFRDGRS